MTTKVGEYTSYPNLAATLPLAKEFLEEIVMNSLNQKALDQLNKKWRSVQSLKIEDFDPKKSEFFLKCWEKLLIESGIASRNESASERLQATGFTLDDLTLTARGNRDRSYLKVAKEVAAKQIARFKTGMSLAEASQPSLEPVGNESPLDMKDLKPEARARAALADDASIRKINKNIALKKHLHNKRVLEEYTVDIKNLHDQIRWMAELASLGKEFDTLSKEEIADQWDAFNQKKLQQEDRGIDPELLKELDLEAESLEQKGTPAKAKAPSKKHRAKPRPSTNAVTTAVQPPPDREKAHHKVSAVTAPETSPLYLSVMKLNVIVEDGQYLLSLGDRSLRWRGAKPSEISTFTDFNFETGLWVKQYEQYKQDPEKLLYMKRIHAIPMERIMNQPALVDKYSYGFRCCGSDGTKKYQSRFSAEMTDKSGHVETGMIRVASGKGEIYHIDFKKSGQLSLQQLTQPVLCPPKEVSEGKEEAPQAKEGGWKQVGPKKHYDFALGFNDTIVITILEDGTIFKIRPLK